MILNSKKRNWNFYINFSERRMVSQLQETSFQDLTLNPLENSFGVL